MVGAAVNLLVLVALVWVVLRSWILLVQVARNQIDLELAEAFQVELRRRGLLPAEPLEPFD